MPILEKLLQDVISVVEVAGDVALSFYGQNLDIKDKGGDNPVTKADLASNDILINSLKPFGYPILSEEGSDDKTRLKADIVWIIDPLDGTKDFIQETGEFTIMVGLVEKQPDNTYRPILGVIYLPVAEVTYCAIKGDGSWVRHNKKEPKRLEVSPESQWHNIVMLTSRNHTTDLEQAIAKKLGIPKIISYGSSLKACLVANKEGHVNLNPSSHTWEWDVCASDIIVREAGGRFTDSRGKLFSYNKKNPRNKHGYLATNGVIHDEIIKAVKQLS